VTTVLLLALLSAQDQLPDGKGKSLFIKACSSCHAAEAVVGTHNTRKGWSRLVDEMIFKGASVGRREKKSIVDYLAKSFPMK